jgi:hypothetical protein
MRSIHEQAEAAHRARIDQAREQMHVTSERAPDAVLSAFETAYLAHDFAHVEKMTGVPVSKLHFETALEISAEEAGLDASRPSSATNPGHDLIRDGVRLSLKTEASKSIRSDRITISKFCEAAWSKEFRSPADAAAAMGRVTEHLDRYDQLLMLRAFQSDDQTRYQLVEIPKSLLGRIGELQAGDFKELTASGSTSARVMVDDREAFTLAVDGSDNKITIRNIDTRLCRTHAEWTLTRLQIEEWMRGFRAGIETIDPTLDEASGRQLVTQTALRRQGLDRKLESLEQRRGRFKDAREREIGVPSTGPVVSESPSAAEVVAPPVLAPLDAPVRIPREKPAPSFGWDL